jgi:hypothetical protein
LIQGHKSQRRIESKIRLITKAAGGPAIEVEPVPRRGIEAVEPGAVAGAQGTIEENARRERQRGGGINKTERVGIGLSSGGINLDLVIAGRKIEQRVSFELSELLTARRLTTTPGGPVRVQVNGTFASESKSSRIGVARVNSWKRRCPATEMSPVTVSVIAKVFVVSTTGCRRKKKFPFVLVSM